MKTPVDPTEAIPSKRVFYSIIADYDLNRSICELIDNAIDIWGRKNNIETLLITINFDLNQQTIKVTDNAGGVKKSELKHIVAPGETGNLPEDVVIGYFGVGTKRAVVALSQDIKIKTRYDKGKTYLLEYDDDWLKDNDDWFVQTSEVDKIPKGTTIIDLRRLRFKIKEEDISKLKDHLEATYARFLLNNKITIKIGNDILEPHTFEEWAYPPDFSPRRYHGKIKTDDGEVEVEIIAGLSTKSSPAGGEYGVYFYCNDRLIARALKTFDVGFSKGLAGLPHPSVSLTRVFVFLRGEAQNMPWNSSKSGINYNHKIFQALRNVIIQVVSDFASLSRRWDSEWKEKVFKYKEGEVIDVPIDNFPEVKKSYLPPLPKSRPRFADKIKDLNKEIAQSKPWTKGLYEGVIAEDIIFKQKKLSQKERIALIILDSTLEIAFKEYLVNESSEIYSEDRLRKIFKKRTLVEDEIKKHVDIDDEIWGKIRYYYRLRCDLIHKRALAPIDKDDIIDFSDIVQEVLETLFDLNFDLEE